MAAATGNDAGPKSGPRRFWGGAQDAAGRAPGRACPAAICGQPQSADQQHCADSGSAGLPRAPTLELAGKSARRSAPAGRAPETPVPRPVWRRCGNWLQGGFAPARHAPPRPLLAAAGAAPAARVAAVPRPAAAGAQRLLPLARGVAGALTGAVPGLHRRREDGQERGLRLPDVRPVRAAGHRVCLPDDLPQAAAQRPLRRGRQRRFLRGPPGPAVRVAGGLRAGGGGRAGRRPAPAAAPRRPPGLGTELVGQLLERAGRRPVGHRRPARRRSGDDLPARPRCAAAWSPPRPR